MQRKLIWALGFASLAAAVYVWRGAKAARTPNPDHLSADESDRIVDEASEESFPASDAPSHTPTLGSLA
jgi:hypothetical protein